MTLGGNTHSGFRIASTFVISREKISYANVETVVYTNVITQHWPVIPLLLLLLLLDGRRLVDTFPAPPPIPRKRMWWAVKCMYQIWQSYLWGTVSIQQNYMGKCGYFFLHQGWSLLSNAYHTSKVWSLNMTYSLTAKRDNWILDERVENTFTAPLQCRRIYIYMCVI